MRLIGENAEAVKKKLDLIQFTRPAMSVPAEKWFFAPSTAGIFTIQ